MLHPFVSAPRPSSRPALAAVMSAVVHAGILTIALGAKPVQLTSEPRASVEQVQYLDLVYPVHGRLRSGAGEAVRRAAPSGDPQVPRFALPPALEAPPLLSLPDFVPPSIGSEVPGDLLGVGPAGRTTDGPPDGDGGDGAEAFIATTVDTSAVALPQNPKPRYPDAMLRRYIEARFMVYFVVDTTGRIDQATIDVSPEVQPSFASEVRSVLAHWNFFPARRRGRNVRQLIGQPFIFHIVAARGTVSARDVSTP